VVLVEELLRLSVRDEKGGTCLICDEGNDTLCKKDNLIIHFPKLFIQRTGTLDYHCPVRWANMSLYCLPKVVYLR